MSSRCAAGPAVVARRRPGRRDTVWLTTASARAPLGLTGRGPRQDVMAHHVELRRGEPWGPPPRGRLAGRFPRRPPPGPSPAWSAFSTQSQRRVREERVCGSLRTHGSVVAVWGLSRAGPAPCRRGLRFKRPGGFDGPRLGSHVEWCAPHRPSCRRKREGQTCGTARVPERWRTGGPRDRPESLRVRGGHRAC